MSGRWQEFDWHGRVARAWVPEPLGKRALTPDATTIRAAEQAVAALRVADTAFPAEWEALARLLLRSEGVASSSIEGVNAPIVDVAAAEIWERSGDAGWIADNLDAVVSAMKHTEPLRVEDLHRWHATLMEHSPLAPEMIGAFRTGPSWIGGTSPLDAAFVAPPAGEVPGLVAELIDFANTSDGDAVSVAALVHAQFETIHPYGDGNGRLGRILIGWVLRNRGVVDRLPPPISVLVARDPGGYISGLYLFREDDPNAWIRWFARTVEAAARLSTDMVERTRTWLEEAEGALEDLRADSGARRLVEHLPGSPVIDASRAADLLGVSTRAARDALGALVDRRVIETIDRPPAGPGRPRTWYAATGLLDLGRISGSS